MARHSGNRDHDRTASEPRRRAGRNRRRRGRGGAVAALSAAVAVVVAVAGVGFYVFGSSGTCGGRDIALKVAASPDIAPALSGVAARFNAEEHAVDDRCVTVEVRGVDSADVAYGITGAGPTMGDTDSQVWIPDSSLWTDIVSSDSGDATVTDTGTSLAQSPLVLATPQEEKKKEEDKGEGGADPSWKTLVPTSSAAAAYDVRVVDPVRSSSGIATLSLVSAALGDGSEPQLIAALQGLQKGSAASEEDAFDALEKGGGDSGMPALVLSEQAATRYNAEHDDAPAVVDYPNGGTYTLDYPYVLRTADPLESRAAEAFRAAATGKDAVKELTGEGFRDSEGAADTRALPADMGFQEAPPKGLPTPSEKAVRSLTETWNQLKLNTRMLTLVDISGSMAEPVAGTPYTRMQVTSKAAAEGLGLFPEQAEIGLWEFSVRINNDLDYRETVPIRALNDEVDGASQKDTLGAALTGAEPKPDGDTGLYDSILAAHREMSRTYKTDRVNTILVLTDGNNDDPGSISLKKLLATLEEEFAPSRPVAVISIAFGPDVDPEPLRKIAKATRGAAYSTDDPSEIGEIFLKSFALRIKGQGQGQGGGN
ncbi:von Willebrand factor type A domain-containing protein [Murinocardiopsis flavida]|uniref:von Willebrand factor type A domain-containing protein n=1 Tax=Murinocardiopsis flavida TaxID=645275 RepID=A0A2P8DHC3_9ACTN|nr:substrate-binding domain-containing protein [Murinocardiopsis flavida]PSK96611.1 von Willebrand factor type A domain-containing protein [Murinocardiopsis flavida]